MACRQTDADLNARAQQSVKWTASLTASCSPVDWPLVMSGASGPLVDCLRNARHTVSAPGTPPSLAPQCYGVAASTTQHPVKSTGVSRGWSSDWLWRWLLLPRALDIWETTRMLQMFTDRMPDWRRSILRDWMLMEASTYVNSSSWPRFRHCDWHIVSNIVFNNVPNRKANLRSYYIFTNPACWRQCILSSFFI